jgi:hypothetical protein
LSIIESQRPFVFVLMPFSSEFDSVYRYGIKAAAADVGVDCQRVDEQIFAEGILVRVYTEIARADVVVADMTGCNPNVFYEVGYAHALNKPVILVTRDATHIPFDLKHTQHIVYGKSPARLRKQLAASLDYHLTQRPRSYRSDVYIPRVQQFDTLAVLYDHLIQRTMRSRIIDDLSWATAETQEKSLADRLGYENYLAAKLKACKEPHVTVREVFTFPTMNRLARALAHIDLNLYGYSASYYPLDAEDRIPRLSFILFDAQEVVIFFYSSGERSARTEIRLGITEPHLVRLFQDYYDGVFLGGIVLKDADHLNKAELQRLRQALTDGASEG